MTALRDILPRYATAHPEPAEGPAGRGTMPCGRCGEPMPWQWIARLGRYLPPPPVCGGCKAQQEAEEATARRGKALAAAGIGERYRGYSWERCIWARDECDTVDDMRRWIAEHEETEGGRWLGVLERDAHAVCGLRDWTPSAGSVYLEGVAGSGKTLLAMCVAEQLIGEGITYEDVVHEESGRVLGCRRRGSHALVTSEPELLASHQQRRQGFDQDAEGIAGPSMVYRAKRAGVLIIDDVGHDARASALMHSIVDARYRAGLPIIATSNVGLDALRGVLGAPTASRLDDMTQGHRYRLHYDWRRTR